MKLIHQTYICNDLTNFKNELQSITGNGNAESLFDKIREIKSCSELLSGRFYLFGTTVHGAVAASKFTVPWSFLQVNRLSGNLLHFSRKSNIYIRGNPQMTHNLLKPVIKRIPSNLIFKKATATKNNIFAGDSIKAE